MIAIHRVVASSSSRLVVFGAFERNVEIWDVPGRRLLATFPTVFDFGGSRLALSDERGVLLAGAYKRQGLAGYCMQSGSQLWHRPDLKKVQDVTLNANGSLGYCGRAGAPCEVVDTTTGVTVDRFRGSRSIYESRWEAVRLNDRRQLRLEMATLEAVLPISRLTFAVLDATFAPGKLLITESAGPLRCVALLSGDEMWRYDPGPGAHVLQVAYRPSDRHVVAIECTVESRDPQRLVVLSGEDGALQERVEIEGVEHGFCEDGCTLITSARQVISTLSGQVVGHLTETHAG
ncbi:MAG: hypothetical protein ABL961_15695 [Vicinamibacterales bacterium]